MTQVKDIRIAKNGASYSLVGQKMHAAGQLRTLKGGVIVRKDGRLYVYSEPLNAHLHLSINTDGKGVVLAFRSLPSKPFRSQGVYPIGGAVMNVRVRVTGQMLLTGGRSDAYQYTSAPFPCDGQTHRQTDTAGVPPGKELYKVEVYSMEVLFSAEGLDAYAYTQGDVQVEIDPRRFTAVAVVSPPGAGRAEASPANPAYGQTVRFSATETDRDAWRFVGWASGEKNRSYSVLALGDVVDTALFEDASDVVDFAFTLSIDANGHLMVRARAVQNRAEAFVMVAFDIQYLDAQGQGQTAIYEREVRLDRRVDTFVFEDTQTAEILEVSAPQFGDMPQPFRVGEVEVTVAS